MLVPNERRELQCWRCQVTIDTACGGYWFLLLAPRGRVRFPGVRAAESVLCSSCGRSLREYLESGAYAPGEAYERVRAKKRASVSRGGGSEPGRASGHSGLVEVDWAGASARARGVCGSGQGVRA